MKKSIRTINLVLISIFIISSGSAQLNIQKRVFINQSGVEYKVHNIKMNHSKYLSIDESIGENTSVYLTPAPYFSSLQNNPIPWYVNDNYFYYVSFDALIQGIFEIRIEKIKIDREIMKTTQTHDVLNEYRFTTNDFYLREMHEIRFNKEELKDLFYDFTVRKSKNLIVASYFRGEICLYEATDDEEQITLCGCKQITLYPPFQIFEENSILKIIDIKQRQFEIQLIPNDDGNKSWLIYSREKVRNLDYPNQPLEILN